MPSKRNEVKREGEIDILINFLFLYPARLIARVDINFVAFYSFASCNIFNRHHQRQCKCSN